MTNRFPYVPESYTGYDFKHEVTIATLLDQNYIPVPKNEVLKGSWSGGLVVRHNRQKMTLTAQICKDKYFDHITANTGKNTHLGIATSISVSLPQNNNTLPFYLDKPIWNGGDYQIGIATWRLKNNNVMVYCNYKTKSGNPLWDGGLLVTKAFASKYPIKDFKNGKLEIYQIPLNDIKEYSDNAHKPPVSGGDCIVFKWNPEE